MSDGKGRIPARIHSTNRRTRTPLSNWRRKPRLLKHAGLQEFILFERSLILSKDTRSRDRASSSLPPVTRARRWAANSEVAFAAGFEKPTTPCKCCGSITGRWWTGRRRRGTFAPFIIVPFFLVLVSVSRLVQKSFSWQKE